MSKVTEGYEVVTARILKALESADPKDWKAPWHDLDIMPRNVVTGKRYEGWNIFRLAESSHWAGMQQWNKLGAKVRKGESPTYGVYWGMAPDRKAEPNDNGDLPMRMIPMTFKVWHAGQVEGWVPPTVEGGISSDERISEAEAFFDGIDATVRHGQTMACYVPAFDEIRMPSFEAFTSADGYYSTLAHEFGHWTGHASRLNRPLRSKYGSEAYAFEELVAELSAAFTMSDLGLSAKPREDHAQYIKSWIKVLKNDVKSFGIAASLAEKATKHLRSVSAVTSKEVAA